MSKSIRVLLTDGAALPEYQTRGASGLDLAAVETVRIPARSYRPVRTGVSLELPAGMEVQVRPRSGLALKHGLGILNSPGTIDSDYRGEIVVILFNIGPKPYTVRPGDRIAQLVFAKVTRVTLTPAPKLNATRRGSGGFGHTGRGGKHQ